MKITVFISILIFVVMFGCVSGEAQSAGGFDLDQLRSFLQNRQVTRIDILHVPDNLETRTRITPEMLRTISKTKVVVDSPWESPSFKGLLASLQELKNAKSRESGDVRWAVLFLDTSGKEISAIYLSSNGSLAVFRGTPLSSQGRLLAWAKGFIKASF